MSARKSSLWCVAKGCNNISIKRHFFRFPKEYDRWLQWICACERFDLKVMGPEYAHRNYRLCHLHFEEKWYKISKIRAHLNLSAIPTIFLRNDILVMVKPEKSEESEEYIKSTEEKNNMVDEAERKTENKIKKSQQEETNSNIQSLEEMPINEEYIEKECLEMFINEEAEIVEPNISSMNTTAVKETSQKKKLIEQNLKLKAENRRLRERMRRLQKKTEDLENRKESKEYQTLCQLALLCARALRAMRMRTLPS